MMIHEITELAGKYKARKRIGRGRASGHGKTSGRGHNGAKSRSGYSRKAAFEGGQMPYFRRIAKRGFTNVQFTTRFWAVNLRDIVEHASFANGGEVTPESLVSAGLIRDAKSRPVKVLGDLGEAGALKVKLDVKVARATASARRAVEAAGGSVDEHGSRRDKARGIDRNTPAATASKLTKKREAVEKRMAATAAPKQG